MIRRQEGLALVTVLVLLLVLSMLAGAFVWRMNTNQGQVGRAQRATAALYLAEAGAEKALWELSHGGPGASRNGEGSLAGYQEQQGSGRFVIEKMLETPEGVFEITVRGEIGDVARRLRVSARLVPKALGLGLYAGDVAAMVRQSRLYVIPVLKTQKASERFGDIGIALQLWVEEEAALNHLDGQEVALRDGSVHDYTLFGFSSAIGVDFREREILPDLVVTGEGQLTYGEDAAPLSNLSAFRLKYPGIRVRELKSEQISMPGVNLDVYRALARENRGNAGVNKAAGGRMRDHLLSEKMDSLYSQAQFEMMLSYLDSENRIRPSGREIRLAGTVFVEGAVKISGALRIDDGALVLKGVLSVADQARLEVRHTPASTTLPGVIAFQDGGAIKLAQGSTVIIDGIVLAETGLEAVKARLDVSGAILTGQGFLNDGSLIVVRYQPTVLGTMGLERTKDLLVRPLSWQEVR